MFPCPIPALPKASSPKSSSAHVFGDFVHSIAKKDHGAMAGKSATLGTLQHRSTFSLLKPRARYEIQHRLASFDL